MTSPTLTPASLSQLDQAAFVAALDGIFEHSPWVAERAWVRRPFADREALLDMAERQEMTLIEDAAYRELRLLLQSKCCYAVNVGLHFVQRQPTPPSPTGKSHATARG